MEPYYEDDLVRLFHGDALEVARTMPDQSVQTIVTSPPYFGLRDYGEVGQIGAEDSLDEYVGALVALFAELRRVLADDGTLWLNLGDSYATSSGTGSQGATGQRSSRAFTAEHMPPRGDIAPKNLLGVPWRVAFALQQDEWILRSDIIWAKPSVTPESVKDRPTKAHEYLFLLAKRPNYYYDAQAIAEPVAGEFLSSGARNPRYGRSGGQMPGESRGDARVRPSATAGGRNTNWFSSEGGETRNRRTVWTVQTVPFPQAHFATYPPELIRPCILAGSRRGDTVLDPFSGSGTTGAVATEEGRRYVGIDLNREYLDLSLRTRFAQPVLDMTGGAA